MSKPSLVIVLVEDEHHEMLIRRYLTRLELDPHKIRLRRSPAGKGSAEAWVRDAFVQEVEIYRNRRARADTQLMVMVDADNHTVQFRLNQLDDALRNAQKEPVGQDDQIARLVPRRNIETWILCLNDEVVDEETDYSQEHRDWKTLIISGSETMFNWTRQIQPPDSCIDSLRRGVEGLRQLANGTG